MDTATIQKWAAQNARVREIVAAWKREEYSDLRAMHMICDVIERNKI